MIRTLPAQTALHFREHKSLNFERTDIRKASFAKSGDYVNGERAAIALLG